MPDPRNDARHHITLVDNRYREKLARIEEPLIPKFVSWAQRIQHYERELERLRARLAQGEKMIDDTPVEQYVRKFEWAIPLSWRAWERNLDMSIAAGGQGRKEIIQAVQHERGSILPSEASGTAHGAQVVVNNGNGNAPKRNKPGLLAALRPKP